MADTISKKYKSRAFPKFINYRSCINPFATRSHRRWEMFFHVDRENSISHQIPK